MSLKRDINWIIVVDPINILNIIEVIYFYILKVFNIFCLCFGKFYPYLWICLVEQVIYCKLFHHNLKFKPEYWRKPSFSPSLSFRVGGMILETFKLSLNRNLRMTHWMKEMCQSFTLVMSCSAWSHLIYHKIVLIFYATVTLNEAIMILV